MIALGKENNTLLVLRNKTKARPALHQKGRQARLNFHNNLDWYCMRFEETYDCVRNGASLYTYIVEIRTLF